MADSSDENNLDDFLEDVEGIDKKLGDVQEQIEEISEDGTIALKTGNFEELVVLMLQDIKIDLMEMKQFMAEEAGYELEEED